MSKVKEIGMVTILLYLVSTIIIVFYCKVEINSNLSFDVISRVILNIIGFVCIYLGSIKWAKSLDKENRENIMRITFIIGLIMYLTLLFTVTIFDSHLGRQGNNIFMTDEITRKYFLEYNTNFIPLKTILHYFKGTVNLSIALLNLIGNLCMFMPLSIFLFIISKKMRDWKWFFFVISSVVIMIEMFQLIFMCGSLDIDDYIFNVGGAFIMFIILKTPFIKKFVSRISFINIS